MGRTLNEIYREGLEALCERLGPAGMVRFLQQFETGQRDYARTRHKWVDQVSMEALRKLSRAGKSSTERRKR